MAYVTGGWNGNGNGSVRQTGRRRVERVKANTNDTAFADALVAAFNSASPPVSKRA